MKITGICFKILYGQKYGQRKNDAGSSQEIPENFHAIATKWLECIKETRKYSTYIKYQGIYERHVRDRIGGVPVRDITHSLVNERIFKGSGEASCSQNLRHSIIALINQILRYAAEHRGLLRNTFWGVPGNRQGAGQ